MTKHTELSFEHTVQGLQKYIIKKYRINNEKANKLASKIFDDIQYMNELIYLEGIANAEMDNVVEARYIEIVDKVYQKYC